MPAVRFTHVARVARRERFIRFTRIRFTRVACALLACCLSLAATPASARDIADSPDASAAFMARARPFEERLAETTGGAASTSAGAAYARFLDRELQQTYALLWSRLDGPARRALEQGQRHWLLYRDAEARFVGSHYTTQRNGSAAMLARAQYRAALVRERVLRLLDYLRSDTAVRG